MIEAFSVTPARGWRARGPGIRDSSRAGQIRRAGMTDNEALTFGVKKLEFCDEFLTQDTSCSVEVANRETT